MNFIEQQPHLDIQNFDSNDDRRVVKKHGALLPNSIRCIICGPSNCGKTNVLIGLLTHENGLRFENIYLYSKSINQDKYEFLEKCLEYIKCIHFYKYANNTNIVKPCKAKPNSIFIFDDVACDKQDCMREYFSMGRHSSVDCFYLCQTYAHIPKHLIRDNANFIILFKQADMNLKHIYNDHVNMDMTYNDFKNFCVECWRNNFGFAVIDKDTKCIGRYRKNFNHFLKWM